MNLTILTYNTLFAGRDGADQRRAQEQLQLISEHNPDALLMQEARGFDADGGSALHSWEAALGMRGFLALASTTGQHVAIFIREPLRPLRFEADSSHFHHALAVLTVTVPGLRVPLTLLAAHLSPSGCDVRRREANYLAVRADGSTLGVLTGDFNSASPHDPEPGGFASLAAHHRARYVGDDLETVDRSVIARLEAAGWIDIGLRCNGSATATVPTAGFPTSEFAEMRCDYVMATASLAEYATAYEVLRTPAADRASDHYPVLARFELPR